jgi:broad specificity phosphatase PhoE
MSGTSRIFVVRHGQSTWNADGRWQGQADPPLSELGVAQAEAAARTVDGVDLIWASDLERAHHTAKILAAPHGIDVVADPRLREREAGEWTGLTRAEIEEQYPGALEERRRPPGFETDAMLVPRALGALHELAAALEGGGTAVAVTHGGVILAVERHHGEERTPVANLEGRWLDVAPDASFALGDRQILFDPDAVEVTIPGQP